MSAPPTKPSTSMPSIKLALPPHVVLRPRASGPVAVFLVNKRDRPPGFPSCTSLPIEGPRQPITDPSVLAAIQRDATILNRRLKEVRQGLLIGGHPPGSWQAAMALWQRSEAYLSLSPNTKRVYAPGEKILAAFMRGLHTDKLEFVTAKAIGTLFDKGQLSDAARRSFLNVLGNVMAFALEEGWVDENPIPKVRKRRGGIGSKAGKRVAVELWGPEDVDAYEEAALSIGWIGGAILVRGMWECMARMYDACGWTRHQWDAGKRMLAYEADKTGRAAWGIMSPRFADLVARSNSLYLVTRPTGAAYDRERMNAQLHHDQQALHQAVAAAGGRVLKIRHLRHSAITDGAARGLTPEQMRANTSHADAAITSARYIQQSQEQALAIAVARGIVGS